ncbi:acetolactate synthase catalytic subunit [Salicibibacter cibarius]|uniref:Acetolactate synthase catalytic subunit n=1 Tax=Salicibibacter cibarius TaxID=2743000 RepID=A0A7T6Z4A8_9BACI|nr:acetolactate synthase catalytic subunit [Salicibibacter cibarius]QQK76537.1 acetolactate synthase catalytic subunit [Salicibibacter cibarius]
MSTHKETNAERIARALKKNGVEYLFGQSNPQTIMLASMDLGIRQIGFRQENAGSYMAQAYAMCSGKVPVVTAQNGPAATLLVPGLAECLKASHPIVALVDEVPRDQEDKNAFQELDHKELFSGVAKWVKKIPSEDRIEDYVDMAFTAAASGKPGPAVLLCPKDLTYDTNKYPVKFNRNVNLGSYPLDRSIPDPIKIEKAADLLANAERPIIHAGGGVISSGAKQELRQIQEECSIPVATTTMGKGSVDEEHPLTIGPIGYYMGKRGVTKFLRPMIEDADVILLVGNRTNQNGTDSWTLLPENATYIHIDVDPTEIGRNYESLRLVGDAKLALNELKKSLFNYDLNIQKEKRSLVEEKIANARVAHKEETKSVKNSDENPIKIERFLAELEMQLSSDQTIVTDASLSSVWVANYIKAKGDRKFIFPRGLAGLGWGLPLAMGANIAKPEDKVLAFVGDGGFAHAWAELETCKREGINVVTVVINNQILAYQKLAEQSRWGRYTSVCDFTAVDHAAIARACGIKGIRVESPEEIEKALQEAFLAKGSVVIDLLTDPNDIPPLPFMENLN